ncbi:MAG: hypothetical protein CVV39_03380 [Planctomycetes bacterium HGW-Planctomycetes-1]|nr:MAG: hypothetical protein CVV39_03380 [Planctomycetes bacterium HGW-Planctomycetes-1]
MKSKKAATNLLILQPKFWLHILLAVAVSLPAGPIAYAQQTRQQAQSIGQSVDYFYLVSTVEYTAKQGSEERQYRHQVEPWFTVTSYPISKTQRHYNLSTHRLDVKKGYIYGQYQDVNEINYDLTDKRYMTSVDDDLQHLRKMNNACIDTLNGKAVNKVGETWTCRYDLRIFNHYSLPDELKFTVSSIEVPTEKLGDLVAVRAISDPFMVKAVSQREEYGYVKCQVASVYLFDLYVMDRNSEDLYVSATKFMAATKMDGMTQQYCYEFGTYKTDSNSMPIDLNGLDYIFEGFTQKIELTPEPLEVNQPTGMPFWARVEIVNAAQIASTCAAVTCEQAIVNPVASVYLAAARTYQFQEEECLLLPTPCNRTVCQALRADVKAIRPMEICGKRRNLLFLWLIPIPIALAHHHHHHKDKSPYKP